MASPIYSNKEVKVSFGSVRMKGNAARPKIATIISAILLTSLFVSIPVPANAAACNPTSTTVSGDTVLTFKDIGNCEWTVPAGVSSVRALVVGGGSSAGSGQPGLWWIQGGGGGAVLDQSNFSITSSTISVTVGGGGAEIGTHGAASTSVNNGGQSSFGSLSANGGIAASNTQGTGGTSGNGNVGGQSPSDKASGGGGGAGGAGSGMTGGVGVNSDITGTTSMYGSGGAGSNYTSGSASSGGGSNGTLPIANRGGGGSQPTATVATASAGGSGVVIVRYAVTCVPTEITASNGDKIVTFSTTGTCSWKVPSGVSSVRALIVGGGGAGGGGWTAKYFGNGGGGGEVLDSTVSVTPSANLVVKVGAGGAATNYDTNSTSANNGESSFFGATSARGGTSTFDKTSRVGGTSGSLKTGGTGSTTATEGGGGGGAGGGGFMFFYCPNNTKYDVISALDKLEMGYHQPFTWNKFGMRTWQIG